MAKHVSTIGPRSSAPAKSCAFAALNGIENALTDATGTVEILDDYTDYQARRTTIGVRSKQWFAICDPTWQRSVRRSMRHMERW